VAQPVSPARPLVVVWRVTAACDLGCWFCEYNRHLRRSRRSVAAEEVINFGRVLAEYAAASGRPVLVSWLGGEPLAWPPLVAAGQRLHDDFGLALGLTTNGWQLGRPGLIQHLAETYAEITMSVDGPPAQHDSGRGAPGLSARLRQAVSELREMRQRRGRGPRLRANTILMRSNVRDLEALCQALAEWGIEEVSFNTLGGQPPGPHYRRERLRPEDTAWLCAALPAIQQRLQARGLRLLGAARYLGRVSDTAAGVPAPVADCHPGVEFLFVDEAGRAAPCAFTSAGYGVPITELRTAQHLDELPARFATLRQQALLAACQDCHSTQVFGKFDWPEAG
jgi:MoaA/NifB/PqqE/SkfB family radical SAM enzyme